MKQEHTPEQADKLRYKEMTGNFPGCLKMDCATGNSFAIAYMARLDDGTHHETGRRIVSCVNACRGLNPEAVRGLVAFVNDFHSAMTSTGPNGRKGIAQPAGWRDRAAYVLAAVKQGVGG